MAKPNETVLGYSGFELFEECYGYNENACFIADTEAAAHRFMRVAAIGEEWRIEPVTLSRIMDDYGYSLGEFAMEREAFERFRNAANEAGIRFDSSNDDFGPELTVINAEGVNIHDD